MEEKLKKYVFYISTAPGDMGGTWDGPTRKIIECEDEAAAKDKIREINANWASVLTCYPLEAEISLKDRKNA